MPLSHIKINSFTNLVNTHMDSIEFPLNITDEQFIHLIPMYNEGIRFGMFSGPTGETILYYSDKVNTLNRELLKGLYAETIQIVKDNRIIYDFNLWYSRLISCSFEDLHSTLKSLCVL